MVWRRWGAGRPLVLVHGGVGSWAHWADHVGRLAGAREVWCPDLPSLGDSADAPAPGDVHAVVATVADGLDALLPGPRAIDVVGFSYGALVSTLLAARRPGRVRRLVLVGAASLGLPDPALPLRRWRDATEGEARRAVHRHNLRTLMLAATEPDGPTLERYAFDAERARFDGRPAARLPLVRDALPTLEVARVGAVYGARDPLGGAGATAAREVLRAARPGLRFVAIEGAGHWVPHDAPGPFAAALDALIGDDAPAT